MAKYTIELRKVCDIYTREEVENWFKDYDINDYLLPSQIEDIEKFNIWNKDRLAKQIVDHYFMREIGLETPALFKHYAKVTMKEIMEAKFPLIYTLSLEYNPLINENYNETFSRNATGKSNSTGSGSSKSNSSSNTNGVNINNDTPQGKIGINDLTNGVYASSASHNQGTTTMEDGTVTSSTGSANTNTNEEYTRHTEGNRGILVTYQALIKQYRENIIAINKEIIEELNTLFMGLY